MKLKLKIMNVFYFAISVAAIFFLLITPLFSATIDFHIDYDVVTELADEEAFEDFGITQDDFFEGDPTIDFTLDVQVTLPTALRAIVTGDNERLVKQYILAPGFEAISEEIRPVMEQIAYNGAKAMVRNTFTSHLQRLVGTGEDFYEKLAEVSSLKKKDVDASIDKIYNSIFEENQILRDISKVYLEEYTKYTDAFSKPAISRNVASAMLESKLIQLQLIDDDGQVLGIESEIDSVLSRFLGNIGGEATVAESGGESETYVTKLFAPMLDNDDDGVEKRDPYSKDALTEALLNTAGKCYFSDNDSVAFLRIKIFCILGIVLLALFLAGWIIKIVNCFICIFRKTPYLRLEPFGIVTAVFQVILSLISVGFIVIYEMGPSAVQNIGFINNMLQGVLPNVAVSMKMTFGAMIPGFIAIGNLLLSIVYSPVKKIFKKETKKEAESYLDIE